MSSPPPSTDLPPSDSKPASESGPLSRRLSRSGIAGSETSGSNNLGHSQTLATEQAIHWIVDNPGATIPQLRELLAIMRTLNRRETKARLLRRLGEARWYHAFGDTPNDLLGHAKVEQIIEQEMERL